MARFDEKYKAEMKKKRPNKDGEDGDEVVVQPKKKKRVEKNKDTALTFDMEDI